jgi:hypothetical protein
MPMLDETQKCRPGSLGFMEILEEVKRLHIAKSQDYGDDEDALANIRSGAEIVGISPWKACLIRLADKMTRLKTVCNKGSCKFDGVEDTLLDMCAYAAISLDLYREEQNAKRTDV